MRSLAVLEQCVSRGVAVFTTYDPHWFNKMDADKLDIYSLSRCVIGQYFEGDLNYNFGLEMLGILGQGISHGFDGASGTTYGDYGNECKILTELWRGYILEMQKSHA
jgi:hypothetical protein